MSNKKGKKSKGKTMNLHDFLGGPSAPPIGQVSKCWADEEEDDFVYTARPKDPISLPTAPRAARDASFNEENVPMNPPFVAYISNLPYDVDEEDLYEFFQDMKVSNMRLPKSDNKFKGYGYVDFEDRQSLVDALSMVDTMLKGRRVRIEVSVSNNDDRRGGRMGRMGDSRREYSPERTGGDWRTARADDPPREDDRDRDRDGDRGGFRSRNFERRDDMRGERDGGGFEDSKPGNWRDAPREPFVDRPRPTFRDSRPGPGEDRDRGMGGRFSDRSGPRGMRDSRDGSRERDGERGGGGFGPRRFNNNDDLDREKDRWSNVRSQAREPMESRERESRPPSESSAPMTRPKLELKPRTKPIEAAAPAETEEPKGSEGEGEGEGEGKDKEAEGDAPAPPAKPATNIFGAARPVDTAAKEREIEERLAKSAEISRAKEGEGDAEKRPPREGTWGRRNGEGQGRFDQDRPSRPTWRSRPDGNDQRDNQNNKDSRDAKDYKNPRDSRDARSGSRGSSGNRGGGQSRGPLRQVDNRSPPDGAERDKKKVELTEEEEISRMPKAKDDHGPNIVSSNKYSMLPDDVDPDNIEE